MYKVCQQVFSFGLYELKFKIWLNYVEFYGSYWALLLLMNIADEQDWWTYLMSKVGEEVFSFELCWFWGKLLLSF